MGRGRDRRRTPVRRLALTLRRPRSGRLEGRGRAIMVLCHFEFGLRLAAEVWASATKSARDPKIAPTRHTQRTRPAVDTGLN